MLFGYASAQRSFASVYHIQKRSKRTRIKKINSQGDLVMLVAGIIITIVAVLMMIFPQFFVLLKNPMISRESLKSTKVKNAFRILSALYVVIGAILIITALVR